MKVRTIRCLLLLLTFAVLVSALGTLSAAAAGTFRYVHDPRNDPNAMKDIVEDPAAVYGFRPSPDGSLATYADIDWTDPAVVEAGRLERIAYHESLESMYDILRDMQAAGKSVEEIARAVSAKRNQLRLEAYANDPEGLAAVKARNLEKYGHEEGPLPDELYKTYGSWQMVIRKAFSANSGMDACVGLYDDYYFLAAALIGFGADAAGSPATADPAVAFALVMLASAAAASVIRKRER